MVPVTCVGEHGSPGRREVFWPSRAGATGAMPEVMNPNDRHWMIRYGTRLFDMRLNDLSDPDQRWALLSDTASTHSRTDPVVFLYQYYFRPARLLAIHVDESAHVQQQEVIECRFRGRDKPSDLVTCERTDVELALCLSATFALCDGFRKLGLQNTEIDAMIRRDFSRLKRVWERCFHFMPLEALITTGVWGLTDGFYERIGALLRVFNRYFERHLEALEAEDVEQDRRFMQSWGERLRTPALSTSLRERR
jgi:hypothetical protein